MAEETRNVFISHIHEDDAGLGKVKDLLSKKDFAIRDSSISADKPNAASNPDYIKSEILAPGIKWAGTMLVYITPGTRNSPWVDWEIKYAHKLGMRIVGVWGQGDAECQVPDALDKYADAVVGWDSNRIIGAIEGRIEGWTTQAGQPREDRQIGRYICRS
jgi:hypothetical protein